MQKNILEMVKCPHNVKGKMLKIKCKTKFKVKMYDINLKKNRKLKCKKSSWMGKMEK